MLNIMKIQNVEKITKKALTELLNNSEISKSSKIKRLFEAGYSIKQISEELGIRYNFAYNVVSNFTTINKIAVESSKQGPTKKELIVEQWNQGNSLKEISINLRTNYNYVFNTVKDYKNKQGIE